MGMQRGLFITLEGPEGCGKTTQAGRLAEQLRGRGLNVILTREPGGTPTGEAIRDILQHDHAGEPIEPQTEALLFAASRAQLVRRVILPALEAGTFVIADRFADSTTVYQGYGRQLGVDAMLAINAFAIDGAEPDVTFLLDLEAELGLSRVDGRNRLLDVPRDRIEREGLAFHRRVREGYLALAERDPKRIQVLQAAAAEADVALKILGGVDALLAQRGESQP